MKEEDVRKVYMDVLGATKGHPPGDLNDRLERIDDAMRPWRDARGSKARKSRGGHDRLEKGGVDREE